MGMLEQRLYDQDDHVSVLPESVILEILSCLPTTKDVIRTSCLSKRWRSLWTLLPTLVFINNKRARTLDFEPHRYFFSSVDKTITQLSRSHLIKLNKFQLHSLEYLCEFESQVNKWIRYAISCNVQDLDLSLGDHEYGFETIVLDELLFNNSTFTHLKLACSFVNPTSTFSWKNLKSLYISLTDLNEDLIQNILSGSPVLETFTLDNCYGFTRLDITTKSVKKLTISGNTHLGILVLKAPDILSLKIQGSIILSEIVLDDLSSLVEAHLDFADDDYRIDDIEYEEIRLESCIYRLRHVKEVKLGVMCSEILSRLEGEGFVAPSNIKRIVDDGLETEDNIVEFDCLVSLLTEVVKTLFDWISKNGEKWMIHVE